MELPRKKGYIHNGEYKIFLKVVEIIFTCYVFVINIGINDQENIYFVSAEFIDIGSPEGHQTRNGIILLSRTFPAELDGNLISLCKFFKFGPQNEYIRCYGTDVFVKYRPYFKSKTFAKMEECK